jgi:hypothetical protein
MRVRLALQVRSVLVRAVVARHQRHASAAMHSSVWAFKPMARMAVGGGPMNTRPASRQACAKSAFSLKNP